MSAILESAARLDKQRASDLDRSEAAMKAMTMDYTLPDPHAAAPVCEPLSPTAIEIGEEKLCADVEMLMHFIGESAGGEREPSWFGPISTEKLVAGILFNPRAPDKALAMAARELRKRYLDEHAEYIREAAERASQP